MLQEKSAPYSKTCLTTHKQQTEMTPTHTGRQTTNKQIMRAHTKGKIIPHMYKYT